MPAITQKGQVTVPKPIRALLGLETGDEVRFVVRGDRVEIERASADHRSAYGLLQRSARSDATGDDDSLMEALLDDDERTWGAR